MQSQCSQQLCKLGGALTRATLTHSPLALRPSLVVAFDGHRIPDRSTSWDRQDWKWPSAIRKACKAKLRSAVSKVLVDQRNRNGWKQRQEKWDGIPPLFSLRRGGTVWFRRSSRQLVMRCSSRCLCGSHQVIIGPSVDRDCVPVLCEIARATSVNCDG